MPCAARQAVATVAQFARLRPFETPAGRRAGQYVAVDAAGGAVFARPRFRPSGGAGAVRCAQLHSRSGGPAFSGRPQTIESMQSVPASLSLTDTAFFFDFDGTLVE
ncbi:hypothetical protein M3583_25205, partial [Bacillus subtilis]|nr:hypothetical protein [Bacillus subtilis]